MQEVIFIIILLPPFFTSLKQNYQVIQKFARVRKAVKNKVEFDVEIFEVMRVVMDTVIFPGYELTVILEYFMHLLNFVDCPSWFSDSTTYLRMYNLSSPFHHHSMYLHKHQFTYHHR